MAEEKPKPIQARSKIKSVQPIIKEDGAHSTYTYLGKLYYEFVVETESGHRGRAAALKETFRWNPGDDVNYSFQEDPIHGDRIKHIAAAEQGSAGTDKAPPRGDVPPPPSADQAPRDPAKYTADPHKQSLITAESALRSAVMWAAAQDKKASTADVITLAAYFEGWIYDYEKRRKQWKK